MCLSLHPTVLAHLIKKIFFKKLMFIFHPPSSVVCGRGTRALRGHSHPFDVLGSGGCSLSSGTGSHPSLQRASSLCWHRGPPCALDQPVTSGGVAVNLGAGATHLPWISPCSQPFQSLLGLSRSGGQAGAHGCPWGRYCTCAGLAGLVCTAADPVSEPLAIFHVFIPSRSSHMLKLLSTPTLRQRLLWSWQNTCPSASNCALSVKAYCLFSFTAACS